MSRVKSHILNSVREANFPQMWWSSSSCVWYTPEQWELLAFLLLPFCEAADKWTTRHRSLSRSCHS
jgi:hypothetical protein